MANKEGLIEKKTLKSALNGLQTRADSLVEVRMLSDRLFDKFKHPTTIISEESTMSNHEIPEQDIIDLFNKVSDNIQVDIDMMHKNLSVMLDMMD